MKRNLMRYFGAGLLALVLIVGLAAPALAVVTGVVITAPTTAAKAYVAPGGIVNVAYTVTDDGLSPPPGGPWNFNVQIQIYKGATVIGNTGVLVKAGVAGPNPYNDNVAINVGAPQGTYDVVVTATNQSGGGPVNSPVEIDAVVVDNVLPTITLTAYAPDPTNDSTPSYAGTATDATSNIVDIEYRVDGGGWTDVDAFTPALSVNYTFTTGILAEGAHTFEVRCQDAAGNWSAIAPVPAESLTIDTVIPTINITAYAPDPTTNTALAYSGTAQDTAHNIVDIEYNVDGGAWTDVDAFTPGLIVNYTFTTTALTSGAHAINVRAQDLAGNWSTTATDNVTVDIAGPAVTITPYAPDPTINTALAYIGNATDALSNVNVIQYQVDGGAFASVNAFAPALNVNYSFTTPALANGLHTIGVKAQDAMGNWSNVVTDTVTVDTVIPTITLTAYTPDPTNDNTPSYAGTATDATSNIVDIEYRVDGGGWADVDAFTPALSVNYTFTTGALADGVHTIDVRCQDAAGNWSAIAPVPAESLTIDTTLPVFTPPIAPNGAENWTAGSNQNITWTVTDAPNLQNTITITIKESTDSGGTYPTTIATGLSNPAAGAGTYSWLVAPPITTTARIRVEATDAAGNTATLDSAADFTVSDSTPPVVNAVTSPLAGDYWGGGTNHAINWNATDNIPGSIDIKLEYSSNNGGAWTTVRDWTSVAQGDGTYAWATPAINSTQCLVRVTARDAATLTDDLTSGLFTIDTTGPAAPTLLTPANGATTASPVAFSWSVPSDPAPGTMTYGLWVRQKDGLQKVVINIIGLTTPNHSAPLMQGNYEWNVTAVDGVGNIGTTSANSFFGVIVDTTPPVVTVNSPNGGESWLIGSTQTITWTATDANFGATPITLSYSTDGGSTWTQIATNEANDGAYPWTVAGSASAQCLVKVQATDAAGNTGADASNNVFTTTAAGALVNTINLVNGWNLISLPLIPDDPDITVVLGGIAGGGTVISVWGYDTTTGWHFYTPAPSGDLSQMVDGQAYWINMNGAAVLTVNGVPLPAPPATPPTYDVVPGWNFIGFKSQTARTAQDYLAGIAGKYTRIYGYTGGAYIVVQPTDNMNPGMGYWIAVTAAGTIYP